MHGWKELDVRMDGRWVDGGMSKCENGWKDGWMDGWVNGRMEEWVGGWMSGWMSRRKDE